MKSKSTTALKSQDLSSSSSSLKTLIDETALFLDHLVELIPPKFYLPGPDADDRPWFQGLSKAAKASAKKQSKENLKKARRQRFNPDHPSSTLDLLQQSITSDQNPNPNPPQDQSLTYDELRQRLHAKLAQFRSTRNTRPKNEPREDQRKRKRELYEKPAAEQDADNKGKKKDKILEDVAFGKVIIGDEDKKKKKLSKFQELEKAKRLEELKKDPEKGGIVAKKHSWKAAESRAMGVKVHDDPKLLRESIKKDKKRQKKSVEKWKERVESRDSVRKGKQKKRTDNIKERAEQKKMRKIEKREKKLMRPGFEGRKEGYINE